MIETLYTIYLLYASREKMSKIQKNVYIYDYLNEEFKKLLNKNNSIYDQYLREKYLDGKIYIDVDCFD